MTKQKSLTKIYFYSMVSLTVVLSLVFAFILMEKEISAFNEESAALHENYIQSQKNKIKHEVKQLQQYINYQQETTEQRLKDEVKDRTIQVFYIIEHIYEKNKDTKSIAELEKMITDVLHSASWDNGAGYFFAFNTDAIETVNPNNTNMVGKNMWDFRDKKGKYVIRDMLAVAAEKGEGYITYFWDQPSNPGVEVKKISYVKLFKPLNWVIGNGKYIDDQTEIIKNETIQRISKIILEGDRYYFGGNIDGDLLFGAIKGSNYFDLTDVNGVKVVQEAIKTAQSGGGFIKYVMPKLGGQKPLPKISYVVSVPDWEWMIGAGIYVNEIDEIIAHKKQILDQKLTDFIIKYTIIVLLLIVVIVILAKYVTSKISNNLETFFDFFCRSSEENIPIDEENISFSEFHQLAKYANQMLERRIKAEAAEQKNYQLYMTIFEASIDAILLYDPECGIIDCNPAALSMFKINDKEHLSKLQVYDVSPEYQPNGVLSKDAALEKLKEIVEKGYSKFEWVHRRLDGEEFFAHVETSRIYLEGKPIIYITTRDISEYKRTQALMIQTEKMLSVGGLAAGMAHEINNPLAGMMQTAISLENRLLKLEQFEKNVEVANKYNLEIADLKAYMHDRGIDRMVNTIEESGKRIANIVKNMLSFARTRDAVKTPHFVTELIDKSLELAGIDYNQRKHYDFKCIEIVKEYEESIPMINCESGMIQQVILNLLQNSAYEMHGTGIKKPRINLRCWYEKDRNMVGIEVEDNGPGIDPAIKDRLFEPFYTTKSPGVGTGLGLSVSYYIIVDDHSGEFIEISQPGHGAKFRIMLPAIEK